MRFPFPRIAALLTVAAALFIVSVPSVAAQSAGWQPGPGAILDPTYDGFVDGPRNGDTIAANGSFQVRGWFVDRTAQGWAGADDVQVWLGTMDGGGHLLAKALYAQSRPDVAAAEGNPYWANSGFVATISGSAVPAGSQTLYVYVHTGGKGWWWKSVTVNGGGSSSGTTPAAAASAPSGTTSGEEPVLTIINPSAGQNVSTKSDYTITGTVNDAGNVDRIEVWIDGERNSQYGRQVGTTTPNSDGSWAVTFSPTKFPSTHSNAYVYAHNKVTGLEAEVSRDFNIVDK